MKLRCKLLVVILTQFVKLFVDNVTEYVELNSR